MWPDNLHLGPIAIHWFGIFFALGIFVGLAVASREFERRRLGDDLATTTVLCGAIGGFLGARLWVIVETWPAFVHTPGSFILGGGGLAWYGGLVGGTLAVTVLFRVRHVPWLLGADAMAPALAVGQAIGRIGCQVAGDGDWGAETTLPWGMAYPHAVVGWDKAPGVRVHPTPLYECAAYLLVFLFLVRRRRASVSVGTQFAWYLVLVGLARFAVDFVRINPRVLVGLTMAQIMSMVSVALGAVMLLRRPREAPPVP
jgi:phosphatidylglycerol:prolipoprotein diacylglycerol transferase